MTQEIPCFCRALKKESVSTYVVKCAPGFCEVLVVNKEKLCYVKKATQAPALHSSSPSSTSEASVSLVSETNMGSDEGICLKPLFQAPSKNATFFKLIQGLNL